MAHSAFVKAHPYVEDFYTEDDKARARSSFSKGLVGGIASIFVGIGMLLILARIQMSSLKTSACSYCYFCCDRVLAYWSFWHDARQN